MPEGVRTPYESAPVPAKPEPIERPFAWRKPEGGRLQSEKILSEIRKERGRMAKRFGLSLAMILIATVTGFFWKGAWIGNASVWIAYAGFFILVGLFPLFALVVRWPTLVFATALVVLALFAPFMQFLHTGTTILVTFTSAALFIWAGFSMRMRGQILTEFRLGDIMQAGIRFIMLGFATLYASAYYFAVIPERIETQKFLISEKTFSELIILAASSVRRFIPQFSPEMTIGDAATALVELRRDALIRELNSQPGFTSFSLEQQQLLAAQLAEESKREIINSLARPLGRSIKNNESVVSVLWAVLVKTFRNLTPETQNIARVVWGTGLWFIVVITGTTISLLFVLVAWILLELFLAFRFFEISRESAERRILTL